MPGPGDQACYRACVGRTLRSSLVAKLLAKLAFSPILLQLTRACVHSLCILKAIFVYPLPPILTIRDYSFDQTIYLLCMITSIKVHYFKQKSYML
jgi:hypothetical protein